MIVFTNQTKIKKRLLFKNYKNYKNIKIMKNYKLTASGKDASATTKPSHSSSLID